MMRISRKRSVMCIIVALVLGIAFISGMLCFVRGSLKKSIVITAAELPLAANAPAYTNNVQYQANVWMGVDGQTLYFYLRADTATGRTACDGWLCALRNHQLVRLHKIGKENVRILGCAGGCVYYVQYRKDLDVDDRLYCYDVDQGRETLLYAGRISPLHLASFTSDGCLAVPTFAGDADEAPTYLLLDRGRIIGTADCAEEHRLGQQTYSLVGNRGDLRERILTSDGQGGSVELPLNPARSRALIPADGCLLIHNEGYNSLLYRIDGDGRVAELFGLPGLCSYSAVAVVGDEVYLSVRRYEKFGDLGLLPYEDDALEGTYRIGLTDASAVKISDAVYSGLYSFDGEHLYACDGSCNVYLLDLTGTIVDQIFTVVE